MAVVGDTVDATATPSAVESAGAVMAAMRLDAACALTASGIRIVARTVMELGATVRRMLLGSTYVTYAPRAPQSVQSVPRSHEDHSDPEPPSSQL
jgi:hypothetical protein